MPRPLFESPAVYLGMRSVFGMHRIWLPILGVLVIFSLVPVGADAQFGRQRNGQDQVCVYRDIQYQGAEQCYRPGDSIPSLQGMNGQPSSIRIYGRASVTVYDDSNFRGHSTVFSSSVPDLGQVRLESKSWNDRIRSLQVSGNGYGPYGNSPVYGESSRYPDDGRYPNDRRYPNGELSQRICVYDRPNFTGRAQCWNVGDSLGDLGSWSDRISSIRTFGGTTAVVYRDIGFRGASFVVNGDIPDLARVPGQGMRTWDHQISSIQIENSRDFRGRGNGRGRAWGRGRQY
jgi:hypothetical protein